ncbi:hypothetical protein [Tabrizicola sp.]|uniref:hypothetical protein n=1 Tax=Tabrizicola sp. TaxID=2005166 RepID=UPI003F2EFDD4
MRAMIGLTTASALVWLPLAAFAADPVLPDFAAAKFGTGATNPYVSLEPGHSQAMSGRTEDGLVERDVITVMGPGPVIMGVQTVTVQDDAFADNRLVERTLDYFATDADGNLWYFGEDVTNYRYDAAGKQTGTDAQSSWRAGVDGAMPGISVPASPVVGEVRFQEYAPANKATDYAEVIAVDAVVTVAGREFRDVLQLFESSTSEPDLREFKYFAKGSGLIRAEEDLSEALDAPEMTLDLLP